MKEHGQRWQEIGGTRFPWEREALDYVREHLPDYDPYRGYALFEFIASDGSINEVDLLVIGPKGLFLVEIKSWPGVVNGDQREWVEERDGRPRFHENPLLGTDRKAKRLKSLLEQQASVRKARTRLPFIQPVVFLSHPEVVCKLPPLARQHVYLRDESAEGRQRDGILSALTQPEPRRVDKPALQLLLRALNEAGIRPARRKRQVGDYVLGDLIREGPGYQDFAAKHVSLDDKARVRIFGLDRSRPEEEQAAVKRAARREWELIGPVAHAGFDSPRSYTETENGPALVYRLDENAERLDAFISARQEGLALDDRLSFVLQLAETLDYAHRHGIVHRGLSPMSIDVVNPDALVPTLRIRDWHAGFQLEATGGHTRAVTSHAGLLVTDPARIYLAPEALTLGPDADTSVDVFSFGTVSYLILTGRPPAATPQELTERAQAGMSLSAVLDGVPESLEVLVLHSTLGDSSARPAGMPDVLRLLADVADETARTNGESTIDPAIASFGDELGSGIIVLERLGAGATAYALQVELDGAQRVLKVARSTEHNDRLRDEAAVLEQLSHACVVRLYETVVIGDRVGLVLSSAGQTTLGEMLREQGRLHIDMLERWGCDLLEALGYLETMGIPHRDIKPDNLGIAERPGNREKHLVLFDFSLSRASADNVHAGTTGYVDPFLQKRGTWDLHADRWAAAVTLYQMASGELPHFGDGRSAPAAITSEATIDEDAFDASLSPHLAAFFKKALRRDATRRYGTTAEMLRDWRAAFEHTTSTTGHDDEGSVDVAQIAVSASLDDPLLGLGVPPRVIELLERRGAATVREALEVDLLELSRAPGVGNQTRRDARELVHALRARFADALSGVKDDSLSIDLLVRRLVPRGADKRQERFCEALLGLDEPTLVDDGGPAHGAWRPVSHVAERLAFDTEATSASIETARGRWLRTQALTAVRRDIEVALASEGEVLTVDELASALLTRRGSSRTGAERSRNASAVARAAVEAEAGLRDARFVLHRHAGRPIVASTVGQSEEPIDGIALAAYAATLGERADELAAADPLLPASRVIDDLRTVSLPDGMTALPDSRLVRLAAAASATAAVSGRLELYPRGLPAGRALTLARGALLALGHATPDAIARRVTSRFPDSERVPERPALDALLSDAGFELVWDSDAGTYRPADHDATGTGSIRFTRRSTTLGGTPLPDDPDILDAAGFERRLDGSARHGGFLCLVAPSKALGQVREELARRFGAQDVSIDRILIHHLRLAAAQRNVVWKRVLAADAASLESKDWSNLNRLVADAVVAAEQELLAYSGVVLANEPGLLARYGQLSLVDRLRDRAGGRDTLLSTLWLLVADDPQVAWPVIDGQPVPVIGTGQWARIPAAWVKNMHRATSMSGSTR
jgi:serine/threonine protein kinase